MTNSEALEIVEKIARNTFDQKHFIALTKAAAALRQVVEVEELQNDNNNSQI